MIKKQLIENVQVLPTATELSIAVFEVLTRGNHSVLLSESAKTVELKM